MITHHIRSIVGLVAVLGGSCGWFLVPGLASGQSRAAASEPRTLRPAARDSVNIGDGLRDALVANNPELLARRLALSAAEARVRAAGHRPVAILVAEAEEIPRGVDISDAGSLTVGIEQEFLSGALRSSQRNAATSNVTVARAAIAITQQRLLASLDRHSVRLSAWGTIARRLAAEDGIFASAEGSIRGRFAVGDARYVDVLRLRTERLRVQADRAAAITEVRAARAAITGLVGSTSDTATGRQLRAVLDSIEVSPLSLMLMPAPDIDSLLASSGILDMSAARVARAAAAQRVLVAEQGRRITASVGGQRFEDQRGGISFGPAISFSTSLPFTARRGNRARAEAARLEARVVNAEERSTLATLRTILSIARDRHEAARARLSVYENALLRGAREERENALATFRTGELSLTELLDFERALARAEVDRIHARIEAAEAMEDFYNGIAEAADLRPGSSR